MFEGPLGANASLVGADPAHFARDVATPALCIERQPFGQNLRAMQRAASHAGVALRPHMKGHKSGRIARLQVELGAIGVCCATAKEAEVAASAGVGDILITTPVVSPMVLARLASLAAGGTSITLVADSTEAIAAMSAAAQAAASSFGLLIDLNVGQNRTGVSTAADAVALARAATATGGVVLRGVQAYYGHLQHVATLTDRLARVSEQWAHARLLVAALRDAGHAIEIVSGGGTGTAELDRTSNLFTEIQAGSYPFIDSQYLDVERKGIALSPSLTVLARVTSTAVGGQVVIDAGTKAIATDPARFRLAWPDLPGATHKFMGDEHSALLLADDRRPAIGDLVALVATHCDPTVNLHQRFHVIDNGTLVDIWPIEARGY